MTSIPKSVNFRSVHASGVYITPTETDVRFFFVDYEPIEAESGDDKAPAGVKEVPHIQAEVRINRDLARWIRDYLNAYLNEEAKEASK